MEPASMIGATLIRALRVALAVGLVAALLAPSSAALAQGALEISTPYPGVALQPGASASFQINLTTTTARQVDLAVSGAPTGWTAALHGGGLTVSSVWVPTDVTKAPDVKLDVKVPDGAPDGTSHLTVTATSGGLTAHLAVTLTVAAQAGGTVKVTSDFPNLKGRSDQTFTFNLQLANDTPGQLTFTLSTTGPDGWTVDAKPASQAQAASFTVDAGATSAVTVTVTPAQDAPSAAYDIDVQAVSGSFTADQKLSVEITGNVTLALAPPQGQPLSTNASAGGEKQFTLVVTNSGTSPAENITMTSTPPTGWTVTFDQPTIAELQPSATQNVIATINPAAEAIAGDYVVSFQAATTESTKSADVRVTVETSVIWGIVGLAIIVLVIGGLIYIFQRYGRR
jgi:uncharacterized repeat protein (TIGR01451 family)